MQSPKPRNVYQLGPYRLSSDTSLPLALRQSVDAECTAIRVPLIHSSAGEVIRPYPGDNGSLLRESDHYVMNFSRSRFQLDLVTRTVAYTEPGEVLIDVVLPEFLAALGELVVHGSAVLVDGAAVLLIGRSGSGKSTLALALERRGHRPMSDDFTPICSGHTVAPGARVSKVWRDSASALRIQPERKTASGKEIVFHNEPVPDRARIGAILFLERGSSLEVGELGRDETLARVMESRYLLDPFSDAEVRSHLEIAASIAENVPAARLLFPHDFALLPLVAEAVERAVLEYA